MKSHPVSTVLVTGGAGYIGTSLTPILLASGYRVRVLDSLCKGAAGMLGYWSDPNFEFQLGDIRNRDDVRAAVAGVDAVIHLAAIVGDPACAREPELARATNLDATMELIAESRRAGVSRLVFASTCSNYGKMADGSDYVDESSELRPVSLYAETKVQVERSLLEVKADDSLCVTPLRFATVFGVSGRMRFDLTVNQFAKEMLLDKHVVVYGEQFWRPYVHVREAARAIATVLQAPADKVGGRVFNVGATEENFQKSQLIEMIQAQLREPATVEFIHRDEDPRDYRVRFDRILNELGFRPVKSVQTGIAEVLAALRQGVISDANNPVYQN